MSLSKLDQHIATIYKLELDSMICERENALIVWVRPNMRHNPDRVISRKVYNICKSFEKRIERYGFEMEVLDDYTVKIRKPIQKQDTSSNGDLEDFIGNHYLTATPYSD